VPEYLVPEDVRGKLKNKESVQSNTTPTEPEKPKKRIKTEAEKEDIQKRWDERRLQLQLQLQKTPQQIAFESNLNDVESKLGIKRGKEMNFLDANEQKGNANYSKGGGYKVNCQSCVVANELRRRGFDVTAQENTKKKGSAPYELSKNTANAWIDPTIGIN